jgi:chaperonin cofactor prefoldin
MKRFALFFLLFVVLFSGPLLAQSVSVDSAESSNWSKVLETLDGVPDDQIVPMPAGMLRMWALDSLNLAQMLKQSESELENLKTDLTDFNQNFQTLENSLKMSADRLQKLSEMLSTPKFGAEAGVIYSPGKEGDVSIYAGVTIKF